MAQAEPSILALLSDVVRQGAGLVEKEIRLARAEVSENVSRVGLALGLMVGGAILAIVCLNLLAGALVALLVAAGLSAGAATLAVAALFGAAAAVLIARAIRDLKATSLVPTRTAESIRKDAQLLKEATHA
ncbi:MAG: phage holin family protein [Roseivivax sp.]|nr:phage holin family protein [Roseivivax sp.]